MNAIDEPRIQVSDRLLERAVELWCRALEDSKWDNGDDSLAGVFALGMARTLINQAIADAGDWPAAIERFRVALLADLKFLRAHNGEARPAAEIAAEEAAGERFICKHHYFDRALSVDYGPCETLARAAQAAGFSPNVFPCKSRVWIEDTFIRSGFGYGAERTCHRKSARKPLLSGNGGIAVLGVDSDQQTGHSSMRRADWFRGQTVSTRHPLVGQ